MTTVVVSRRARENLDHLRSALRLPDNTGIRVRAVLSGLETFPELGRSLTGRWAEHRVLLGPWPWMLLVYRFVPAEDRVVVVTIQDARSSAAATSIEP